MKVIYIMILLLIPQLVLASEFRGTISTTYDEATRGGRVISKEIAQARVIESSSDVQVKAARYFADNSLLRFEEKIYVIEGQMKRHLKAVDDLLEYRGVEIIDVEKVVIDSYQLKKYRDGDLIRCTDLCIYVLAGKYRKHILNLEELREGYFGVEIFNVSSDIVARYSRVW